MGANAVSPVLIIGGSGIVGAKAAAALRRLHPDLPLAIGGRDVAKADAVARQVGAAVALPVDLGRVDLGLPADPQFSAVVVFVKDDTLNSLRYAQAHGLPHLGVSSGVFEVGPEMGLFIHRPARAPVLMASNWLAGAATFPALLLAKEFRTVDAIEIAAVLDEEDMGGPAAFADFERLTTAAPSALILENGRWLWAKGDQAVRRVIDVDGVEIEARAYSPLDVLSLASATDARSVRFDLIYGQSASRRRGERFSTEIVIEIEGEAPSGNRARRRWDLVHPDGQAPVTALCVALAIERLLGLAGGPPARAGLYLPEVLIDPAYVVRRLEEFGMVIRRE